MSQHRIFFITNRNYLPQNKRRAFGQKFNPDGVAALRFGYATVGPSPTFRLEDVFVYPEKKGVGGFEVTGSKDFLDDLRTVMDLGDSDTLIFVHGFNVSFLEALVTGARMASSRKAGEKPMNIVVFTWPSDGTAVPWMSYYSDREDARASGPAVARAFLKLRDFIVDLKEQQYCDHSLHMIAHSMGAYVLRNAIQALIAKDSTYIPRLFDQIMLAAPDEDDDAFETDRKLRLLPRIGRHVTVYYNQNDRALLVSDKTKANPDRLGSDGPRLVDLIPKKVSLVDCQSVKADGDKLAQHSYFVSSAAMQYDRAQLLNGIQPGLISNRTYVAADRSFKIVKELDA